MGQVFASDKHAFGFCDRCGFRYALYDLKTEVVNLNPTNLLVCPSCWDPDQPQNQLGRYPVDDPQALRNPRPNGWDGGRSVVYDYDSGLSYFVKGNLLSAPALTQDSDNETYNYYNASVWDGYWFIRSRWAWDGGVPGAWQPNQRSSLYSTGIDTTEYSSCRVSLRFSSVDPFSTQGKTVFFWSTDTEATDAGTPWITSPEQNFVYGNNIVLDNPMGDQFLNIDFDLLNTGTDSNENRWRDVDRTNNDGDKIVTSLRFDLNTGNINAGVTMYIQSISFS